MSIYSGFATRQIEQTYNIMVEQLFKILQKRLLKFYRQETVNENAFADCIKKLLTQMSFFERQKHLPPKFSDNCKELAAFLKLSIPSNVSLFATKKNKELNQQQVNNKQEDQHNNQQQNIVKQNIEMPNVNYGEPLKSEINISKNDYQHSLFSTNTFQAINNEQKQQIQNNQNSNKFRDGKQNFITLEAAYNNSSSSMSPNTSIHSSLASLGKNNINNQKIIAQQQEQKVQDQQKNIIKEYNPQKNDTQANLVRQIVEGQKKVIQTIDQKKSTELKKINTEERPQIQGNIKNRIEQKILQENISNEATQINENSLKQFRVIKKFPIQNHIEKNQQQQEQQQNNQILSQKVNTLESNGQIYQTLGDETQIVPLMNKKKNKRSHTTKRQRKRNQILNNIYMNGEDFSTVQVGSSTTTAVNLNNYQKRSRSSYRSQEQYNSKRGWLKLQQENYLVRSDSEENRLQESEKVSSNNLDKQIKMSKFNNNYCESNTNINSTNGSYNPSMNVSRQNLTIKSNNIQNQINQDNSQQLNQRDQLEINCDQTMYSVKHQISESANKFGNILQNKNNPNQSMMVESFNSRISRQKLDTNLTINDTDEEPLQSKINQNKNQQNKKQDNNSSIELKSLFYPFNDPISTKNRTPQKQRVLQNSSLNNSLQSTQTALKQNTQQNGGSYQFNQMYKNETKAQNGSNIYQHLKQKQNIIQNSSKKRLYSEDSSKVFKFSNNQLDQSTSDEQFKNNSSFNASNISKKESISPQKKKNFNNSNIINSNQMNNNSNNTVKQNIVNNKISSNIIKQNILCNNSTHKEQNEQI